MKIRIKELIIALGLIAKRLVIGLMNVTRTLDGIVLLRFPSSTTGTPDPSEKRACYSHSFVTTTLR